MPINASHEYFEAEKRYLSAQSLEEKIFCLEEMIRKAPKHKGSENLLKELKTRLKKLKEKFGKGKGIKSGRQGIRKDGFQAVLIGKTNSGKSFLLSKITNASPKISEIEFTTKKPELGIMNYEGVNVQIVDLPSVESRNFDVGIANNADCLILVIDDFSQIADIEKEISRAKGKRIVVFNKVDLLGKEEIRKLDARMSSKKMNFVFVSCRTGEGVDELKKKAFEEIGAIRIYTKEPGKEKTKEPIVLKEGASVGDVAERIYKGFKNQIKEVRLTGPSGKFANQKVGLKHKLKDKDVVEFKT